MDTIMYRNNLSSAQLVMEMPPQWKETYEMGMLLFNEPEGLLPVSRCSEGDTGYCYYDVTGAAPLSAVMMHSSFTGDMIRRLLQDLCRALDAAGDHLLDGGKISLDPQLIYYGKEGFRFCYVPFAAGGFLHDFAAFASFISDHVGDDDLDAMQLAAGIYRIGLAGSADLAQFRDLLAQEPAQELPGQEPAREMHGQEPAQEPSWQESTQEKYAQKEPFVIEEEEEAFEEDGFFVRAQSFYDEEPESSPALGFLKGRGRKKRRPDKTSPWGDWSQFNR